MIEIIQPNNGARQVDIDTPIILNLIDLQRVEDLNIYLNQKIIVKSGITKDGFFIDISDLSNVQITHSGFLLSKTNILTVDIDSSRRTFSFKTKDYSPPKIFIPLTAENSEIKISIKDLLSRVKKETLRVFINGVEILFFQQNELKVDNNFKGFVYFSDIQEQNLEIYLKSIKSLKENFKIYLSISDEENNNTTTEKDIINKIVIPKIELLSIFPEQYQTIRNTLSLRLTSDQKIDKENLFLTYILDDNSTKTLIAKGELFNCLGSIRINNYIEIDLENIDFAFNKIVRLNLQIKDDNNTFYEREFNYSTILSKNLPEIKIKPEDEIITQTDFFIIEAISYNEAKIDISSISVKINDFQAITNGLFNFPYYGQIREISNKVELILNNQNFHSLGDLIVEVTLKDCANNNNSIQKNYHIESREKPTLEIFPKTGIYNTNIRINISSNKEGMIYYTLDGNKPIVGNFNTFSQMNPIKDLLIHKEGKTQLRAKIIDSLGNESDEVIKNYEIDKTIPKIEFLNIVEGQIFDKFNLKLDYKIILEKGFLTKAEIVINDSYRIALKDLNLEGSINLYGFQRGNNKIEFRAYNQASSVGKKAVTIYCNPSTLNEFIITNSPLQQIKFSQREYLNKYVNNEEIDVHTIAIIGYGLREEDIVLQARGDQTEGQPINFSVTNSSDGRHFRLKFFPIIEQSMELHLVRKNQDILLERRLFKENFKEDYDSIGYFFNEATGEIVLDHPLELNERLYCKYISEQDINNPTLFEDLTSIYNKVGYPSKENTLALASKIAFENYGKRILLVQLNPYDNNKWEKAYELLKKEECYYVVPTIWDSDQELYQDILFKGKAHVERMAKVGERKERVLVGFNSLELDSQQFDSSRVFMISLEKGARVSKIIDDESQFINNSFICSALAGKLSSLDPTAEAIGEKLITGLEINKRTKPAHYELEKIIEKGFVPIFNTDKGLKVFRGRTSYIYTKNPILEEISIQRTVDDISKRLRKTLELKFIGQLLTKEKTKEVIKFVNTFLQAQNNIINTGVCDYCIQDEVDPRQIELGCTISPLYPLNNINIQIQVSMGL